MNVGIREAYELAGILADILRDGGSTDLLQDYGRRRLEEWRGLLGIENPLTAEEGAEPWIRSRIERLLPCIPSTGSDFRELAGQLGLNATLPV